MPLAPEVRALLIEQERAFVAKFGREMGLDDPIFFDPNADTPQPMEMDSAQMRRELGEAAKKAGIPEELIYAFNKTGILLTAENRDLFPDNQVTEFQDSVRQYREMFGEGEPDEDEPSDPPLPAPTVNPDEDAEEWTEADIRRVICNPLHALNGTVTDATWIGAARKLIETEGLDQFLVNMLHVLREELIEVEDDDVEGGEGPTA
ncbi:MAG TPA: hypothetical protein VMK12_09535 [Anaeromyxobacteraceae bacterium]|nr:hypothetical protein [Anaeromyxobacteraceae bacterium]